MFFVPLLIHCHRVPPREDFYQAREDLVVNHQNPILSTVLFYEGAKLQWGWTLDRWLGNIDEVRISDSALSPSQFLFAPVPEPTTASLALLGGLASWALRRKVKA
jgi:hypothetical protein